MTTTKESRDKSGNDRLREAVQYVEIHPLINGTMQLPGWVLVAYDEAARARLEASESVPADRKAALDALDRKVTVKEPEKTVFCTVADLFHPQEEQTIRAALIQPEGISKETLTSFCEGLNWLGDETERQLGLTHPAPVIPDTAVPAKLDLQILLGVLAEAARGKPIDPETCETIEAIAKIYDPLNFSEDDVQALYDCGDKVPAADTAVREALQGLLDRYLGLVNSGDAGFWDAEKEDEVIAARKALATVPTSQPETDLDKCPGCGGPADNGHDRELPPSPYFCTKCDASQPEAGWIPVALEYFQPPFKYEPMGQTIFTGKGNMCLQVRGWGNLIGGGANNLPTEKAEHVQDEFGQWVTDTLNAAAPNQTKTEKASS